MKIAYFTEWNAFEQSGVLNKISGQTAEWTKQGHEVKIFLISIGEARSTSPLINATIFNPSVLNLKNQSLKNYLKKYTSINNVTKSIAEFSPDIIYYRQAIWYPKLTKLLQAYPSIMEINTLDTHEIVLSGNLKASVYKWGREKVINAVDGFVAVSHEIADNYKSYKKPIQVVSNGIDLSKINPVDTNNKQPNIIFVGSPNQAWHGVDKLVHLAEKLPDYTFHLVGPEIPDITLPNLHQHGYLNKEQLAEVYKIADIGIGTLAWHRNQMQEGSPLKVREYLAYGLPTIVGYKDTDLEGQPYILNIGNYELNVQDNQKQIKGFIDKWSLKKVKQTDIKSLISFEAKETERLKFFSSIISIK